MRAQQTDYSTKKISKTLLKEIKEALKSVHSYGSVEMYIQDGEVTQITIRKIQKTRKAKGKDK